MVILEGSGDLLVGVNKNVRLEVVLASFCVVIFQLNVYVKTHLNKSGCNSSETALTTQALFLGLCDDGLCVLGLGGRETGQIAAGAALAEGAFAQGVFVIDGVFAGAFLGDIAGEVGNIAVVDGLVPDVAAIDGSAGGLADDFNVSSLLVGLDYRVRGSWTRVAVDDAASDRVGIDNWRESDKCECKNGSEHHFE